jgi:hypothetical protein
MPDRKRRYRFTTSPLELSLQVCRCHVADLLFGSGKEVATLGVAVLRIPLPFPFPAVAVIRTVQSAQMHPKKNVARVVNK